MKLWIDEDLSPALVEAAHSRGLDAACNRDRGLLGGSDVEVLRRCIDEDRTLVTNNFGDFRRLCETRLVHPGLLVMPTVARDAQKRLLDIALNHIERQTTQSGATDSGEFMINRVVEIDEEGVCTDFPLPN
jgi:predicted nuclease of predicted toxin-antitoxin system